MSTSRPPAALLERVSVVLDGHAALVDVDLAVPAARLTVLTGPNGAGKSTLLEVLAGVRPVASGRVARADARVAFVPQRAATSDRLPVTVREVVTVGAWGEAGPWRPVGREGRRRVADALRLLGLTALARRRFGDLSGGERQRALLAQGLSRGADLLLLDEPTTGLDAATSERIRDAILAQVARGVTVVCVSHDDAVVALADRRVELCEGRLVDAEPARLGRDDHRGAGRSDAGRGVRTPGDEPRDHRRSGGRASSEPSVALPDAAAGGRVLPGQTAKAAHCDLAHESWHDPICPPHRPG